MEVYDIVISRSNYAIGAQLREASGKIIVGKVFMFKKGSKPVEQSFGFGEEFGKLAKARGAKKVVFKRGKNIYHGRVKAFAEGLRRTGLEF